MKIKGLTKGMFAKMEGLGKVQIVGISKSYIKLKQLEFNNIVCTVDFTKKGIYEGLAANIGLIVD